MRRETIPALTGRSPGTFWPLRKCLAVLAGRRLGDEEVAVQRAVDRVCVAASGGSADRGGVPQGGDQRGVVLRLAQEVRGAIADAAAFAAASLTAAARRSARRGVGTSRA